MKDSQKTAEPTFAVVGDKPEPRYAARGEVEQLKEVVRQVLHALVTSEGETQRSRFLALLAIMDGLLRGH